MRRAAPGGKLDFRGVLRDNFSVHAVPGNLKMAETEEQKTEDAVEQKTEAVDESKAPSIIWSQKRVPNIEKGYNTSVPFYMMGIFVALIILSVIFAKITS